MDLRPVYSGRRVALVSGVLQGKAGYAQALAALGASKVLAIGAMGTGPLPECERVVVEMPAQSPVAEFRAWERLAASPTAEVASALDRFAPDLVLSNGFESFTTFAGRPVFGARRPEWTALEDKTTVDALWDAAGVARAPSEVVPLGEAWAAHERLDRGQGTVWSGDNRSGWHGGGEYVRRVRSAEEASAVSAYLGGACDAVRVVPFLDGLPCSIHGFVTPTGVAALRPVEMVVLRSTEGFRYAGCATTWDPAPDDREAMRSVARRVGEHLAERVGYRGGFTIDGVMTADGFRPTELNPRLGAGVTYVALAAPEVRIGLLHFALIEGAVHVDHEALERTILPAADATRARMAHTFFTKPITEEEVVHDGDVLYALGPGPTGGFLRVMTSTTPPDGRPFAPVAAAALAAADERWSLGLGPLEPAPVLR